MLEPQEIIIRLLLATIFGALIGFERERKHWAAGLRTHMMVCVGSALIMMVSSFGFSDILGNPHVELDPSRIAAQVVSGIGFLGAGTILFLKQGVVRGLTTAAGLWTVAAIGLATGGGMYFAACATSAIALLILWGIQPLERSYFKKSSEKILRIVVDVKSETTEVLQKLQHIKASDIRSFSLDKDEDVFIYEIRLESFDFARLEMILSEIRSLSQVKEVYWAQ